MYFGLALKEKMIELEYLKDFLNSTVDELRNCCRPTLDNGEQF
jgi:hypothetical protein